MVTIHIVAGPHCALKTSWFRRAFKTCLCLSAEDLYDQLAREDILLKDGFLANNFEDIWMNTVVQAIETAPPELHIAVDGFALTDEPYAYNFSTAEAVYRFIDIVRDAVRKNCLHRDFCFVIHWLALPLPLRQILNHRRQRPYATDQLRYTVHWDTESLAPGITLKIHNTDEVFNAFYVE